MELTKAAERDDVQVLQRLIGHGGEQAFELVPLALRKVIVEEQWRDRLDEDGNKFTSFEAFVTHRLWHGLETTIDDLRACCRKHPEVVKLILGAMEPEQGHGTNRYSRVDIINSKTKGGTSALYTLKRLKRDRPDLFEQVISGAMSANAAAIEAGWRRKLSPLDRLRSAWKKATSEERDIFMTESRNG